MDGRAQVGDCKAPKFLLCHFCNLQGHRQAQCPGGCVVVVIIHIATIFYMYWLTVYVLLHAVILSFSSLTGKAEARRPQPKHRHRRAPPSHQGHPPPPQAHTYP